ncbi:MotB family protein [Rhizobium cremeum]|uniref:MotB family protein n=1 Tax=Rhizobium cremeum TaxID=2813827 RepID=UPI000DD9F258|nr:MotB family protein [Rhizobium cremeum]MCJ7997988.1 MotB family protein [Rhizobium cremeum]MCJ8003083.1 MotB family protein [Rhizobium cremeum]
MSEGENHHRGKNEIIIVKRHKGDHDGAHGGAWKIAYADFMTAMMAFFLVMWLVNAANEETKASISSYFNPIKLTDETPSQKGVKEPAKEAEGEQTAQKSETEAEKPEDAAAAASGDDLTASSGENTRYSEADFFENPYAVLAEIAQEVGQQANVSVKGEGGAANSGPSTGASGGEAYRDPFDPDFWSKQVAGGPAANTMPEIQDSKLPDTPIQQTEQAIAAPGQETKPDDGKDEAPAEVALASPETARKKPEEDAAAEKTEPAPAEDAAEQLPATPEQKKEAEQLREEISRSLAGVPGKLAEGVVVTPSEGGTLLTISEQSSGPMFDIGSAVPQKELVLAMEKIGAILKDRPGSIIIRGHTDIRPYRGKGDNWSLSMDRAHAAYYMLVRGGLQEDRVKQMSGFADRRLQTPDDPMNGANRRIEILISDG